jgi:exodeoxyribonuclease VII small subunit
MEKNLTYEEAFEELRTITQEIEQETVSVDILAERVKRASQLIAFCQAKLKNTEVQVSTIIRQMETGKKNTEREE